MMPKLTPAKRKTLQFVAEQEFVSAWPAEFANSSVRKALEANGLIEKCGHDTGRFGFIRYHVTQAGRDALAQS